MAKRELPAAYVLSCRGGAQGELGLVRSLGRKGVRVVLVGEHASISSTSRYCSEAHVFPELFDDADAGVEYLVTLAGREAVRPVLFPTADPDLLFVSRMRRKLEAYFHLFVSTEEIVENLIDKGRFFEFAQRFDLPTPKTSTLDAKSDMSEIAAAYTFPVILKPLIPQNWGNTRIKEIVNNKKAVLVDSTQELIELHRSISEIDDRLALQEYVPGRDDRLFSLHAYIDRSGKVIGSFTGQKIRTCPAYAGIGCYVRGNDSPKLRKLGLDILKRMDYRGLALAQFKQHSETGEFLLLEINPRLSSWNSLATASNVDLPYAAYCDCAGIAMPPIGRQDESRTYLFFEHDLSAMLEYVRNGDLSVIAWLRSLFKANTFQYFAREDLGPFWFALRRWLGRQFRRLVGR